MGSFPETQNDPKIVVDLFFTITLTIFVAWIQSPPPLIT